MYAGSMLRPLFWPVIMPSLLFGVGMGAILPVMVVAALDLGASGALASAVVSLMGAVSLLLTVPAGFLIHRLGDRKAMVFGTAASAVVTVGIVLALSSVLPQPAALVLYVLMLLCLAPVQDIWSLARQAVVAERMPPADLGRAMTALGGTQRVGNLVGPMVTALLLLWLPLWSVYVFSALCGVVAVGVLCLPGLSREFDAMAPDPETTASLKTVEGPAPRRLEVRWKAVLLAGFAISLLSLARVVQPMMVQLWGVHIHLHESGISVLVALGAALELLLMFPGAAIKDRLGRSAVLALCLTVFGLGFMVMAVRPALVWMVAAVVVMAIGNGLGAGVNMTIGADLSPRKGRAKFLGIWAVFNNSGKLGGPAMVAALLSLATLPAALVCTGAVALFGAAWTVVFARTIALPRRVRRAQHPG